MKKIGFFLLAFVFANISFGQDNVMKFQADVSNRNGDVIRFKDKSNKVVKEIKVNKKGVFLDSFSIEEGLYLLDDTSEFTIVYLKNGFDLNLKMDAKHFDESIVYKGKGSKENNYLAQKSLTNEEFEEKMMGIKDEKSFNDLMAGFKATLEKRLEDKDLDSNFVTAAKGLIVSESKQMEMQFSKVLQQQKIIGSIAPSFDFVNYAGGKTKLEDLRGKYVYIDVWATWCGPCRGEIPHLAKVEEKYKDKNIAFVSISVDVDKDFEKWKTFVKDKSLGGIQLFADKNWNSDFTVAFGINSIPRFILIDPAGKVLSADEARPSEPKLAEKLDLLLK